MLTELSQVPEALYEAEATELYSILGGPVLIHLTGRRPEPLFLSVLLHGNEITGWHALRSLLRRYRELQLPRSLSVFIGNVEAARASLRHLDSQPDYNRSWPGYEGSHDRPEYRMMQRITDTLRERKVFASVDVHNNTGINPHYACVNAVQNDFLHLATLFSRTVVYFTRPVGVQSSAFASLCPSVTVECGQVGQKFADQHALEYIQACLNLSELPRHPVAEHDLDLFHTVAIIKVPEQASIGFGNDKADFVFSTELDHLNFRELAEGERIGHADVFSKQRLTAWDNKGHEVGSSFFRYQDGEITLARAVMPSMLTRNERVIRQDCLGYLMERYPQNKP